MRGVTRSKTAETAVFDCLAGERRRVVLSVLRSHPGSLSEGELAARVATRRGDGTSDGDVRTSLHHVDLPKLERAGLVERDDGAVSATDHPVLADPAVRRAIDAPTDADRLDEVYAALADERRQRVLQVLADIQHDLDPREVAVLVAARETDRSPQKVPVETVDRVHASLYHVHLPKLETAGLVDRDDGTVTGDVTDLPVTWSTVGVETPGAGAR